MTAQGELAVGNVSADSESECMDVHVTGNKTVRVTVRTNGVNEPGMRALALKAAPASGLAPRAMLYTQFTSNGYLYVTYVITWR